MRIEIDLILKFINIFVFLLKDVIIFFNIILIILNKNTQCCFHCYAKSLNIHFKTSSFGLSSYINHLLKKLKVCL